MSLDLSDLVDTLIPQTGESTPSKPNKKLDPSKLKNVRTKKKISQDDISTDFRLSEYGIDSHIEGARYYSIEELLKLNHQPKVKRKRQPVYFRDEELPETYEEFEDATGFRKAEYSDNPLSLWYKDEDDVDNRNAQNTRYKKDGTRTLYTQEHLDEWARCRDDIMTFCKYAVISNIDYGSILVPLRSYQQDILNLYENERNVILKLPRQIGKTLTTAIHLAHFLCFNDKDAAVVATNITMSTEILDRVKEVIEMLPDFLQPTPTKLRENSVRFSHGAEIRAYSSAKNALRGQSISKIFIDELAFIDDGREIFTKSILPVVSSGRKSSVIIASTPNGVGNIYYDLWKQAIEGKGTFKPYEGDWRIVQNRLYNEAGIFDNGEEWERNQISSIGIKAFEQEHCCSFIGSAKTLIDGEFLDKLEVNKDFIEKELYDENTNYNFKFKQYKELVKGNKYIIGLDPSEGVNQDYTTLTVVDTTATPNEIVGIYHSNTIYADQAAAVAHSLAKYYNNAWIVTEINNPSGGMINEILYNHYEYENLYRNNKNYRGVKFVKQSKAQGCDRLKRMIEVDKLVLNNEELIKELLRFALVGRNYQATDGHDDLVMSLMLIAWALDEEWFYELWNNDQSHLEDYDNDDEYSSPFAFAHTSSNGGYSGYGFERDEYGFEEMDDDYSGYYGLQY